MLQLRALRRSQVCVAGHTRIGAGSTVHAFATVGAVPQDLKHDAAEASGLAVGERCRIFEYAHLSGGTALGGGLTTIGDDAMLMSHCHVGHDCALGTGVVLASYAVLAGHVVVGEGARVSGASSVHQKVEIGRGAFVGGASALAHDLIPYGLAVGNRAHLAGVNLVGLRRARVSRAELRGMLRGYRYLFERREEGCYPPLPLPPRPTLSERAAAVASAGDDAEVPPRLREVAHFLLRRDERPGCSVCLPPPRQAAGVEEL